MNKKIEELRKEQQALNEKIDALEQELKQTEPQGKWKPEQNEPYYVATTTHTTFYVKHEWNDDEYDNLCYNAGLIHQTAEEAAEIGKQMYYQRWFRNLSDVTNEMWMDISASKYNVYYDWDCLEVCYDSRRVSMVGGSLFYIRRKIKASHRNNRR